MGSSSELHKAEVNYSGLMEILGKNLYSTPTVALRELIQNAHDSIIRREAEDESDEEARIVIVPDPVEQTLTIRDTGAGLTRDEVIDYLATVGSGYTGELRKRGGTDELIGAFGLGFLTSYVVSDRVEVWTTSYRAPEETWYFSSRTGERFTLEPSDSRSVGTEVFLHLSDDFEKLSRPELVAQIAESYCSLLGVPIHVGAVDSAPINDEQPPWKRDLDALSSIQRRKIKLGFAARYESFFEPICTMDIADDSDMRLAGLLWVQDGATYGSSDNRNLSVYVRGMLITHDHRDLLPQWAGFVGGVVESPHLTPKASREDLIRDETYQHARQVVRESLIDGLAEVARQQPAAWRRILRRHNEALLGAAIADERLFALLADDLTVPTSQGDLTIDAIRRRSDGKIHVSSGPSQGHRETLQRAMLVPVIDGGRYGVMPFVRRYSERRGATLIELGTERGDDSLFPRASVGAETQDLLDGWFGAPGREVIASRFEPTHLPAVLVFDQEVKLKERVEDDSADERISSAILGLARDFTDKIDDEVRARLFVNLDAAPIQALLDCEDDQRADHAATIIESLAEVLVDAEDDDGRDLAETLERMSSAVQAILRQPTQRK